MMSSTTVTNTHIQITQNGDGLGLAEPGLVGNGNFLLSGSGESALAATLLPGTSITPPVHTIRAGRAWAVGIQIFNDELTKDNRKKILVASESSIFTTTIPSNAASSQLPTQSLVAAGDPGTRGNAARLQSEAVSPFTLLIKETQDAAKRCDERKSGVQKKLEQIFMTLDRYAQSVDVLIQQHPDTTAIAWGIIRMLITVAASDQSTSERLSTALVDAVDSIARCEDYQNIYPNSERLETITARLYAEVINFLVRSKKYYSSRGVMRVARSAAKPFEVKFGPILRKIEKLRQEVRDEVQLLSLQNQVTNTEQQTKLHRETSAKEREKNFRGIRYWLDATHFDHLKREKHWQQGTCEWIMEKPEFLDWLNGGSGPFWLCGIPGCGKTVMSAFLQERLCYMRRPIFQFFCKNDELSKRKPPFIVSTLLSQLLDHPELVAYQDRIVALITMEYNKNKDITKVSMDALCALLGSVLLNLPPVIIIIDALDECDAESLSRGFLIEKFIQLSDSVTGTKVILTSRQEEPFVEMIEQCTSLEMSKDDVSNDIEAVIRKSIESIPKLESLKDKVISALVANADGMFLWAELMLASLKKARNRNAVEKMLTNLPVGLREMYEHILISIGRKLSDDELHFRKEIFSWVTTAVRPMTLAELSIALAIELDTTSLDDGEIILKLENDIRDLCGPMLRISGDGIVQVVHMSVRDMLHRPTQSVNRPKLSQADQKYLVGFTTEIEHAHLASACITYLAFEVFRDHEIMNRALCPPEELTSVAKEHLMLEYATSHWIYHICASANAGTKLLNRVLEFLQSDNAYIWIQLVSAFNRRPGADFSIHILQRAKLLDWAKSISKQKGSESNEIINTYLVRAMQAGVELSQTSLGDNHVQTLQALQRLAYLYDHEDRLEESRAIHQTVIKITTGTTDHEAQRVLHDSCIELAYIYRLKANYDQAVNLLELVLGGPDPSKWTCDCTSAEAMADLSVVYRHKGDLDRAREIGEKGAEGLTVTMGPTDILTIRYVIELCRTYFECGLYDKAQALLEHTLKTADEVMGPEQSRTLHGRDLLGNILHAKGKLDTAETLLRDVLRLMQQQCGEGGRSTALVKTHVADVLVDKGEWAEASVLYAGAAETYDVFYGVEHPNTRGLAFKLARCYRELALVDSAESVMAKYRVSLDDVKDADLVKRVFASNLKDVTAETEKSPGEVVVEEESVRAADITLPPSDKPRSNVSSLVEEVLVHNEKKWNDAMLHVSVCNALPAAVAF